MEVMRMDRQTRWAKVGPWMCEYDVQDETVVRYYEIANKDSDYIYPERHISLDSLRVKASRWKAKGGIHYE